MTAGNARWLHAADALFMAVCAVVFASRSVAVLMAEGSSGRLLLAYVALCLIAQIGCVIHLSLATSS